MKKIISLILLTFLCLGLFPAFGAGAVSPEAEDEIKTEVRKAVDAYAASVNRPDAADGAFTDYFIHGFFGHGSPLHLKEGDDMVAALFNTMIFKDALVEGIGNGIIVMNSLDEDILTLTGGPSWHNYYCSFVYSGYLGENAQNKFLGDIAHGKDLYGEDRYQGPLSKNDETMQLLVGGLGGQTVIRRSHVSADTITYDVEIHIEDSFNFNGSYKDIADKGFDTSKDDRLNNLGLLLTLVGLEEFVWDFNGSFSITLPNSCSHRSGSSSYHWSFDGETQKLISHSDNGFTINESTSIDVTSEDMLYHQFRLDNTVFLRHDKPWVVEYSIKPLKRLSLSALPTSSTIYPYILQHENTHLWVPYYETFELSEAEQEQYKTTQGFRWHYMGAEMQKRFQVSSKRVYSFHLENRIAEDGSNMLWVSVYDNELEKTVYGPEPLNDYWTSSIYNSDRVLTLSDTDMLSGRDILINYIGSKSNPLRHDYAEIWIWEDGKDAAPDSDPGVYRAPSCTQEGGYVHLCRYCGCEYLTGTEPATGHSYTETLIEPDCVSEGYTLYSCHCGSSYTAEHAAPLGHDVKIDASVAPGCIEDGLSEGSHCGRCGQVLEAQVSIPATGHNWDAGKETLAPTKDAEGICSFICLSCGFEKEESIPPLSAELPFSDVPADAWYFDAVNWALYKNITTGVSESSFGPGLGCTRAQVVCFLWRSAGSPAPSGESNPFSDVAEDTYYYDAVLWAVENGITSGLSENVFGPSENCSRAQIVSFLYRYYGSPGLDAGQLPFTDVNEGAYYHSAVLWAVENGITNGSSPDTFSPNAVCTRAQVLSFLHRSTLK